MKAILIIFLFSIIPVYSQIAILSEEADSLVIKGSDYIYNVQFDSARVCFEDLIELYPNHPAGYFLDAMVDWWRITIHRNNNAFEAEFLKNIDRVIDKCDELLDKNPKDITALFFKGGALGYRGRYYASNENWINAASDGKEAYDIMSECHKAAPGNHDIMLGTGIYNYYAAVIPEKYPIAKPLMTFLPVSDKSIGLFQLKAAAYEARYSNVEAMVALMQAYYFFENDYNNAFFWIEKLYNKYPNNPYFHRYYARCLNKFGKWNELEEVWREIVKRSISRMEGYNNKTALEGLYFVGLALQRKNKHQDAIKYLSKCMEVADYIDEEDKGFYISAQFKLAYSYEMMKDYKKAKEIYKKCLESEDSDNVHERAQIRLDNLNKKN